MNTAAIYRQYQTYVRSDKSGWALDGCSDSALMAQAKQPGLHLEMCINRFDSGITLSRMRGGGTGAFPTEIHNFSHNCALFVMVSGQNRLQMGGREYRPSAGEIWLVRGELADVSETLLPDNGGMCALHLDFSLEKLRRWHDEGLLDERLFSPQTIGRFALQRLAQNAAALTAAACPPAATPVRIGRLRPARRRSRCAGTLRPIIALHLPPPRQRLPPPAHRRSRRYFEQRIRPPADHRRNRPPRRIERMLPETLFQSANRRNRRRTPAPPAAGTRARPHRIEQHRPSRHALLRLPPRGTVQRSVQAALRIFAFGCEEVLMGSAA